MLSITLSGPPRKWKYFELISLKARLRTFSRSAALRSCLFHRTLSSPGCLIYQSIPHSASTIQSVLFLKCDNVLTSEKRFIKPEVEGTVLAKLYFRPHILLQRFPPRAIGSVCLINRASSYSELLAKCHTRPRSVYHLMPRFIVIHSR